MAFITKYLTKIRNNWKKSTFAAVVLSYGTNWAKNKYDTNELMRDYCTKASIYGRHTISNSANPRRITVILNPAANKRSATEQFDQYCAPILNLAGICVDVILTESEGHAKDIVNDLSNTDALIIGGGDGTLSEVITGLLRRTGEYQGNVLPIGILPLGKSNSIGNLLFPGGDKLKHIKSMGDACMAIIQEATKPVDVMKIEVLEENEENNAKPIYAVSSIEWGAYRDAENRTDKYWYYGPLRKYMTYVFNGYKDNISWKCEADILYSPPCNGCSNCFITNNQSVNKKWYQKLMASSKPSNAHILNTDCTSVSDKTIVTSDLKVTSSNFLSEETPQLQLSIGPNPNALRYLDFVSDGFKTVKGEQRTITETIQARQLELKPVLPVKATDEETDEKKPELWFSIDKEDFEVKPVRVTILPRIINMFCSNGNNVA